MTATPNPMERVAVLEKQVILLLKVTKEQETRIKKQEAAIAALRKEHAAHKDHVNLIQRGVHDLQNRVK